MPLLSFMIVFAVSTQLTCQNFKEALDSCFLTLYTQDTAVLIFAAAQVAEKKTWTTIVENIWNLAISC